jgi:lipopolysaccharide transport system ATP-binding protein
MLNTATGGELDSDASGRVFVRSLDSLNIVIEEGERVAIVGHNGAGKSTLLRVLAGIYRPTQGEARIGGEVSTLMDISLGLSSDMTGRENILLRAALFGISKQEAQSRLEEVIEFSELGNFIDVPVRTYSSGMSLRLAFSVATMMRPNILIMDEWLSVGDDSFARKAEIRLLEMVMSSQILVLATHSREMLDKLCTRAIWLEHGKIRMDDKANLVGNAYFGQL